MRIKCVNVHQAMTGTKQNPHKCSPLRVALPKIGDKENSLK